MSYCVQKLPRGTCTLKDDQNGQPLCSSWQKPGQYPGCYFYFVFSKFISARQTADLYKKLIGQIVENFEYQIYMHQNIISPVITQDLNVCLDS